MKNLFSRIVTRYSTDESVAMALWQELEKCYSNHKRHYHTFHHIENMLRLADDYKTQVKDWETLILAIFYHDAVYDVVKSDNEEKSAELAEKRLRLINFPAPGIALCSEHILATKSHQNSENQDTNLLIDIDLSILGADWETYQNYTRQIRQEYAIYPDLLYKPGRKKVLTKFLERDFIFKTPDFREKFEAQARRNLKQEILGL